MSKDTALAVTRMMEVTVADGTSYRAFHDARGGTYLPGVTVAGKTGTLTDPNGTIAGMPEKQGRYYTWFTGFAPSRAPEVAVAVLVVNGPVWKVKANVVAREMLRAWLDGGEPEPRRRTPRGAPRRRPPSREGSNLFDSGGSKAR